MTSLLPAPTAVEASAPRWRRAWARRPAWLSTRRALVAVVAVAAVVLAVGPSHGAPFVAFRAAYERARGVQDTGLRTGGEAVVAPPDWQMFSYDTRTLAQAALATRPPTPSALLQGLEQTTITGADGDERGYQPEQHEGVNPSDVYFGRFDGFVFSPVTDDPLSGSLSDVPQLRPS